LSERSLWTWLTGIRLLRHPEIVRHLGEVRLHLRVVDSIRSRHPSARISDRVELSGFEPDRLQLGDHVTISAGTVLAFGDELNTPGNIVIGERTWIGQHNNLRAGGGIVRIGRDCLISQFCTIVASNHGLAKGSPIRLQPPADDRRGVTIEDDVWIGAGATILPGVTIHTGAVIGAGSVVVHDIPALEIWGGVPGRRLGERQ
jgi:acetyltransferase-like isoleucine patch superfamily enzyme